MLSSAARFPPSRVGARKHIGVRNSTRSQAFLQTRNLGGEEKGKRNKMQGGDLEESGGELRLRKQQAAAAPLPPPPRPPPSAAAAAAAASKSSDDKRKKLKTPSWLVNARRVNVWSVKVTEKQFPRQLSRSSLSLALIAPPLLRTSTPSPTSKQTKTKTDPAPAVGRPPLPLALLRGPLLLPRPAAPPAAPALAADAAQRVRLLACRRRPPRQPTSG